ncbi:MAG: hypothetical protein KFB93_00815 [Simkaniaceae bacterium]|nr:MAG: hypothetical protein KFB93_00815 [Simkaniaceae bacterium]
MAGMVTNVIGKSLTAGVRLSSYGLGIAAAGKMTELGFRAVNYITAAYTAPDTFGGKVVDFANEWHANPRGADRDTETAKLLKQIVVLTLLSAVIHDTAYYLESAPPEIYNTLLSFTPIRVLDYSILESVQSVWTNFDAKALFVKS